MDDDHTTGAPEFVRSAEELQAKLAAIGAAEAMSMAHVARDLAATFRSWQSKRPTDAARIAAIQQLMELNRRVMDYLAQRKRTLKRPSS